MTTPLPCPSCGAPVFDDVQQRGIRANAIASQGARVVELRDRAARLKDGDARTAVLSALAVAESDLHELHHGRDPGASSFQAKRTVVLYRDQGSRSADVAEREAIAAHFGEPLTSRLAVREGDLVIGRYSVLPFHRELEADVRLAGGRLINSATQHEFVAEMCNWYPVLEGLTPKTWFRLEDVDEPGPFVLKGSTNSRKHSWSTHMFAPDRAAAGAVHSRLFNDGLIGQQEIVIRRYVPLVTYGHLIGGLPVTKEWRFFVVKGRMFAAQFYWENFCEDVGLAASPLPPPPVVALVQSTIEKIGDRCCFYALDAAECADGTATVIELNDGQMSGLSGFNEDRFYFLLAQALRA